MWASGSRSRSATRTPSSGRRARCAGWLITGTADVSGPAAGGRARLADAGQVYGDQGRAAGRAGDLEGPVDRRGAFGQAGQAGAAGGVGAAHAVVADDDVQPVTGPLHDHLGLAGLGVLGDVGQA